MVHTVALFGEAEKGDYKTAYFCQTLSQLMDHLGEPPKESQGLHYAVQALLYRRNLIFFRVEEEGFSTQDYLLGLHFLENRQLIEELSAIFLPGVGDAGIIQATSPVCDVHKSLLITNESDFYDLITSTNY